MPYKPKDQVVGALTALYVNKQSNPSVGDVKSAMTSIMNKLIEWARDDDAMVLIMESYCNSNESVTISDFTSMMNEVSRKLREFGVD